MINFLDRIKQVFAPVSDDDVPNKKYVDDLVAAAKSLAALATRKINTAVPLTGGGNMSADRTISISAATAATATAAGAAGSVVYAPDNAAATVRNQAVTPAALSLKAPIASPKFTGTIDFTAGTAIADTQAAGNNSTRLATTAFVQNAITASGGSGKPDYANMETTARGGNGSTWTVANDGYIYVKGSDYPSNQAVVYINGKVVVKSSISLYPGSDGSVYVPTSLQDTILPVSAGDTVRGTQVIFYFIPEK